MEDLLYYIVCLFGVSVVILVMMNSYSLIFTAGSKNQLENMVNPKKKTEKNKKKVRFNTNKNKIKTYQPNASIESVPQYNQQYDYAHNLSNIKPPQLSSDKKRNENTINPELLKYSANINSHQTEHFDPNNDGNNSHSLTSNNNNEYTNNEYTNNEYAANQTYNLESSNTNNNQNRLEPNNQGIEPFQQNTLENMSSNMNHQEVQSMSGDNYFADGGLSPFTSDYGCPL